MFRSLPEARMLVSFFSLRRVDGHVARAAVLADDHAFVDLVAGADEHLGPLLQAVQAEGHRLAGDHRDQHAVGPAGNLALHRLVALEAVVHDRRPLRGVQQPRPQADQAAGGDRELDVRVIAAGVHLRHLPAAAADQLHHRPQLVRAARRPPAISNGSSVMPSSLAGDDARLADRQLVAFAAHGLDQHRQVQQAAAGDGERIGAFDGLDPQGDVLFQLLHQPLAQVPAGDVLAFAAGQAARR